MVIPLCPARQAEERASTRIQTRIRRAPPRIPSGRRDEAVVSALVAVTFGIVFRYPSGMELLGGMKLSNVPAIAFGATIGGIYFVREVVRQTHDERALSQPQSFWLSLIALFGCIALGIHTAIAISPLAIVLVAIILSGLIDIIWRL